MHTVDALTATTSQAVTNRLADRRMAAAAAAPPDEATPTEPHRYIPRPSLPRRRVGQLQVAGDGAAAALKGVPPCSSQVLPPAEPGSGRVAPSTKRVAYTWRVVGESAYSASIRCSVVRPSQQARFSHPPPRWPTEDGASTWERESRTCRRGSQGAQGEQGARGVTDGSRACGRAGSSCSAPPQRHVPAAAVPSPPFVLIAASAVQLSSTRASEAIPWSLIPHLRIVKLSSFTLPSSPVATRAAPDGPSGFSGSIYVIRKS